MILNWKETPLGRHVRLSLYPRKQHLPGVEITGSNSLRELLPPIFLDCRVSDRCDVGVRDDTGAEIELSSAPMTVLSAFARRSHERLEDTYQAALYDARETQLDFESFLDELAHYYMIYEEKL
jgi:hypothetical protein